MTSQQKTFCGVLLLVSGLAFIPLSHLRPWGRVVQAGARPQSIEPVPAFHAHPPQGIVPETMNPELFSDLVVQNAYKVAAKIKKLLYQQPCYCHCDKSQGHTALLDCFGSKHGAGCNICIYENFYTYEQSRKGKTAAQIRNAIIKGEWQALDVSRFQKPFDEKEK
jgi:hypothetical protein